MAKKLMLAKIPGFKEYLDDAYNTRLLTMADVAKECNVSPATILNSLNKFSFKTRETSDVLRGRKRPESFSEKLSKAMKGRIFTSEHKRKISETRKAMKFRSPNWNGGKRTGRTDGYIQIYMPSHPRASAEGYVMEHILVMCQILNRIIESNEIVHHINGKRDDNRPENLAIFKCTGDHTAYHAYFRRMKKNA